MTREYTAEKKYEGRRIDICLADITSFSRSFTQKLIKTGNVTVNNKVIKANYKINEKDKIKIFIPELKKLDLEPEDIPLDIIYEDNDIIVINKPKGMTVHPGAGSKKGTLVSALLAHCSDLSGIGGVERPGIVHRLDKDTSGIIIAAKNDSSHIKLSNQFSKRQVSKTYLALVHGIPKNNEGIIEKPIGRHPKNRKKMAVREDGRTAKTKWKMIKSYEKYALLEVNIYTGRTHQIRVHLNFAGLPVVGDQLYGKKSADENLGLTSQFLHAYKIGFTHPKTEEFIEFTADISFELKNILKDIA
ncbi:MAG: RluA family pseudouridine synthase [Armatimonadota bacterium]